jgi:catechol 2,3-dioxygenase-like lactoylglutathione lyase family enzyme
MRLDHRLRTADLAGQLRDVDVVVGARVNKLSRGGKNNRVPRLTGVHHVTVPSSDPLAASDWYVRVFDFAALLIEERENEVMAVLLQHQCGARLLLRRAAEPLAILRGYALLGLSVGNHDELLRWVEHLTTSDVEHSGVHHAHLGWAVTVIGPDLVRIQLHTDEGPSGEDQ